MKDKRLLVTIASALKRVPLLYDAATYARHKILPGQSSVMHRILRDYTRAKARPVNFLQVGANDGLWNDPIRFFVVWEGWKGVLVEPVTEAFASLQKNYRQQQKRLRFVQAAVALHSRASINLYRVSKDFLERLGGDRQKSLLRKTSFSRNHIASFLRPDEQDHVICESVPADDLIGLWASFQGRQVPDVVVLDLEGYETQVLLNHPFEQWAPELLIFESIHMAPSEKESIARRLESSGYICSDLGIDTVASREASAWTK